MGRMGPRTERSAGQRTFLLLMFMKVIATASNLPGSLGSSYRSVESVDWDNFRKRELLSANSRKSW